MTPEQKGVLIILAIGCGILVTVWLFEDITGQYMTEWWQSMLRRRKQRQKERLFEEEKPNLFKDLTWSCHICNKVRPDNKISVVTKPIVGLGSGEVNVTQNIRYCNDNPVCYEAAKAYSHFHLAGGDDA